MTPVGFLDLDVEQGRALAATLARGRCHVIIFHHADPRFPFLWDRTDQPTAR